MKKLLTLIFILCTVALFAEMRGGSQYDPGAARSSLSNVDAAATPSMTSITLSGKVKAAWADILGDIYASGTVKVSTGTAAAPAYSFASDPDTGMYSPAADNLAVSVAGAEALRVNSAGEVLIATSTDAGDYKLQLAGTGLFVNDAFDKHIVLRRGLNDTHLSPTTSPDNGLWVWAGSDYTKGVKTFASGTFLINTGPLLIATNTETIGFKLINNGKAYFTDEVLIATATDAGDYKLQVNGNAYVAGLTMPDDKNTHRLVIGRFSAALPYAYLVAGETDKDAAVGFQFRARNAAGAETATMIIDGAGNSVLVATSTPDLSSRLQVGGAIRLTGVSTIANPFAGQIYFDSDDGHFYGYSGTAWIQLDN